MAGRSKWISCCLFAGLLVILPLATESRADKISLLADFDYLIFDNESTQKQTGVVTDTEGERFSQLYSLAVTKFLTPVLSLNGGGTFETTKNDTDTDGISRIARDRQIRPFLGLELNTTFLQSSLNYRTSERETSGSGIQTSQDLTDEYSASFTWKPVDLPRLNMDYTKLYSYDEPKTRDSVIDSFSAAARYDYQEYNFSLNHTRSDNRNKLDDFESKTRNNTASILYTDGFMDDRLSVSAGVKLDRSTSEFSKDPLIRTIPRGDGYYLLGDSFPENNSSGEFTDVNAANPFSDVNIGSGGGTNQVSFGLFFSADVRVDVIWVPLTPDQDIGAVANSFSWALYVSDDQLDWQQVPIANVEYIYKTDNILQGQGFRFRPATPISGQYLKLVTTPLSSAVPNQDINILDVQAWTIPASNEITTTGQYYSFGLDYQLSEKTSLAYDSYYQTQNANPGTDSSRWTNGVSLRHLFSPVFAGTTRLLRSESWQNGSRDKTNHNFSASLNASYLKTFNQTLSYSMSHTDERDGSSTTNSVVLRSNLDIYRGFSLILDQGFAWQETLDNDKLSSFFIRGRTHIKPHRRLDFNLEYNVNWDSKENEPDLRTETGRFNGFWLPLDTLSFSTDINVRRTDTAGQQATRVFRDYVVSWAPLLRGDLQFSVVYTESNSTVNEESGSIAGTIRWKATSYSLLTASYSKGTNESDVDRNKSESIFLNLRVYY